MTLKEFIENELLDDLEGKLIENYLLNGLFEELYGDEEYESYEYSKLYENLMSCEPKILKSFLERKYSKDISKINITDSERIEIYFKRDYVRAAYMKMTPFINDMQFLNYEIEPDTDNKVLLHCIPLYNKENCLSYIQNDCGGFVFHITKTEELKDKILKTGLRCKAPTYRATPERIYLFATEDYKDYNRVRAQMKDMLEELQFPNVDECYVIKLRVDLLNKNFKFYKDSAMDCGHAYFTYNNIPTSCIVGTYKLTDFLK